MKLLNNRTRLKLNNTGNFLKKVYEFLTGSLVIIFATFYWSYHMVDMCDNKSKHYKYAHSLSQERLEKIYLDFKKYADDGKIIKRTLKRSPNSPKEFQDLEYTRLILTKRSIKNDYAIMRLSFCMDTSIDIEVHGLLSENPKVKIVWGELERIEEVLWQKIK
jgi:hypothetical protein